MLTKKWENNTWVLTHAGFEKEARYNFLNMYYDLGGNK